MCWQLHTRQLPGRPSLCESVGSIFCGDARHMMEICACKNGIFMRPTEGFFFFKFFNLACTCLELVSHLELKCAKMGGEAQAGD